MQPKILLPHLLVLATVILAQKQTHAVPQMPHLGTFCWQRHILLPFSATLTPFRAFISGKILCEMGNRFNCEERRRRNWDYELKEKSRAAVNFGKSLLEFVAK